MSGRAPCRPTSEQPSVVPGHECSDPWGPQGPPPPSCVHCTDGMERRSRSLVSALSGRPGKDKAGWALQSGLAASFTLSCAELKSFVVFGFEIQGVPLYSLSHNGCELRRA